MNYKKIYYNLCQRSLSRKWQKGLYEKHHIIPKSLGGSDRKDNIAILTPREHALAHLLLVKFLTGEDKAKMIFALKTMISYRNKHRQQLTTRQYSALKQTYINQISTPEYSAWRSELTRKQWTPERRESVAAKTREQWATGVKREVFGSEDYRSKKSEQMKERWKDQDYAREQSERALSQWQDPSRKPNRNR